MLAALVKELSMPSIEKVISVAAPAHRNTHGNTAIHNALQRNAKEITVLLLESGANLKIKNNKQEKASTTGSEAMQAWFAEEKQHLNPDVNVLFSLNKSRRSLYVLSSLKHPANQTNIV